MRIVMLVVRVGFRDIKTHYAAWHNNVVRAIETFALICLIVGCGLEDREQFVVLWVEGHIMSIQGSLTVVTS